VEEQSSEEARWGRRAGDHLYNKGVTISRVGENTAVLKRGGELVGRLQKRATAPSKYERGGSTPGDINNVKATEQVFKGKCARRDKKKRDYISISGKEKGGAGGTRRRKQHPHLVSRTSTK